MLIKLIHVHDYVRDLLTYDIKTSYSYSIMLWL